MSALIFHSEHGKGNGNMFATPNGADSGERDAFGCGVAERKRGARVDALFAFHAECKGQNKQKKY